MRSNPPAGIAVIVVATLVTAATAYSLATRALGDVAPNPALPPEPQTAQEPSDASLEHEAAVRSTVACLTRAGFAPQQLASGQELITRISVDTSNVDAGRAQSIIDGCRAQSGLATASTSSAIDVLLAPIRAGAALHHGLPVALQ